MYTKNIVYMKSGLVMNLNLDHDDTVLLNMSFVDGKDGIVSVVDHSKIDDTDVDGLKKHLDFHLSDSVKHISTVLDAFGFETQKKESHLYHIKLSEIDAIIEEGGTKEKKSTPAKKQTSRRKTNKSTKSK